MVDLDTIKTFLVYSQWSNGRLVEASKNLSEEQLDRPIEMGRGNLRKTLIHIWAGEHVWLERWKGEADTPWPNEGEPLGVGEIAKRLSAMSSERAAFLESLDPPRLSGPMRYLDSLGGYYGCTLGEMMMQGCIHSTHHRAQAVNMLRRLGAEPPELDYAMWVRKAEQ